jgi:Fur family ferric uptake transcriptional regulator
MHSQLQRKSGSDYDREMTRATKQRSAINQAIVQAARPLFPHEILASAKEAVPNLNLATVYRNLNALIEERLVTPVQLPGQPCRFEIAGHHHHHFLCRQCDRVFDIHACSAEISRLAPVGFQVEDHEVILYGRCPGCSPSATSSAQ